MLRELIEGYTRESGVRDLERRLAALFRHQAVRIVERHQQSAEQQGPEEVQEELELTIDLVRQALGPPLYLQDDASAGISGPGVAAGLVWTPAGGLVQFVEAVRTGERQRDAGAGSLHLTGQLGDVLSESGQLALSWVRANARGCAELLGSLGCSTGPEALAQAARSWDVHVHLPSGSTPKDGPSAGVTLVATLVSLFGGAPVRPDVAMTGEITLRQAQLGPACPPNICVGSERLPIALQASLSRRLVPCRVRRGQVLPVGGVKEKVLAAHRAGMTTVVLPDRNRSDLDDLPTSVRSGLRIVGATDLWVVLREVFDHSRIGSLSRL